MTTLALETLVLRVCSRSMVLTATAVMREHSERCQDSSTLMARGAKEVGNLKTGSRFSR